MHFIQVSTLYRVTTQMATPQGQHNIKETKNTIKLVTQLDPETQSYDQGQSPQPIFLLRHL